MPVMEIIRHKTFAEVRKTAKSPKVSCHESFMVYGIIQARLMARIKRQAHNNTVIINLHGMLS